MTDTDKRAIKEMAQIICLDKDHRGDCDRCCYYNGRSRLRCSSVSDAEKLYAKGYRKQKEGENVSRTPSLFECSVCHWRDNDTYTADTSEYNYCPNCGAKMKGGAE